MNRLIILAASCLFAIGVLILLLTEPVGEPGHVRPAVTETRVTTHLEGGHD